MQRIETANAHLMESSLPLQQGVVMDLPEAATVSGFACRVLNIELPAFYREVQTLILNNKVVDEPENTHLKAGDVLVLSGAMPGLVGAMLRSNSPIKALRESISAVDAEEPGADGERMIIVKFFNTILKNHKEDILNYGFYLPETTA